MMETTPPRVKNCPVDGSPNDRHCHYHPRDERWGEFCQTCSYRITTNEAERTITEPSFISMDGGIEIVSPCSHGYCHKCACHWVRTHKHCPICWDDISKEFEDEQWQVSDMITPFLDRNLLCMSHRFSSTACSIDVRSHYCIAHFLTFSWRYGLKLISSHKNPRIEKRLNLFLMINTFVLTMAEHSPGK